MSSFENQSQSDASVLAEISGLRAVVDGLLAERIDRAHTHAVSSKAQRTDHVASILEERGVEGAAAKALAGAAHGDDLEEANAELRAVLRELVRTSPSPIAFRQGRTLIALVGPTGVGKTTTAAKIAASIRNERAAKPRTVALISTDTFRVAATDQLATYAELLDIRFHVAASAKDLRAIIARETADVVIVDTSGQPIDARSTEAFLGAPDLRKKDGARHVEVVLCVPASIRAADAARLQKAFAIVEPTSIAVTKLDETEVPAGVIHAPWATSLPVSTLCMGCRVPEDIAPATARRLADILFPETAKAP